MSFAAEDPEKRRLRRDPGQAGHQRRAGHGPCQRPEDGGGRLCPELFDPRQEGGHDGLPGKASRGADGFLRPCSPGDPQRGRTLAVRFPAQEKPGTQLCAGLLV